jgi:hypothetical protein
LDARGNQIWLKMPARIPYLAINCSVDTNSTSDEVIERFDACYASAGFCSNDPSYLVDQISDDCSILLCATRTKKCAFLVMGEVQRKDCPSNISNPLLFTFDRVVASIDACERRTGLNLTVVKIKTELSQISN